jgi:hypothetical protein
MTWVLLQDLAPQDGQYEEVAVKVNLAKSRDVGNRDNSQDSTQNGRLADHSTRILGSSSDSGRSSDGTAGGGNGRVKVNMADLFGSQDSEHVEDDEELDDFSLQPATNQPIKKRVLINMSDIMMISSDSLAGSSDSTSGSGS